MNRTALMLYAQVLSSSTIMDKIKQHTVQICAANRTYRSD
jgi:hypothetical protein